jgi:hypothetical protein
VKTVTILLADRAASQVRSHAWDGGLVTGQLQLDVAVEHMEAAVAADLRRSR